MVIRRVGHVELLGKIAVLYLVHFNLSFGCRCHDLRSESVWLALQRQVYQVNCLPNLVFDGSACHLVRV